MSQEFLEVIYEKFVFRVQKGCLYHAEECWAREEGGMITVGVTDFLQRVVGDVAFLELPKEGKEVVRGMEIGTMETIKTSIALISPVGGRIKEINANLFENPQWINTDPYGEGWIFKIAPNNWEADKKELMDALSYFPRMKEKIKKEMAKK